MKRLFANKKLLADLCVILALLLLAGGLALALRLGREAGGQAVVRVDGRVTERHSLAENGVYPLNGGTNILVVENGEAWVSEADCPDKVCMGMGKISRNGEFIACLPNRVLIVIEGAAESSPVDGMT